MQSPRPLLRAMTRLRWLGRLLLAGTFLYAGALKALDPAAFLEDVRSFALLPDPYAGLVALGLPWLEIVCAVALLFRSWHPTSARLLALCLSGFIIGISQAWLRGIDLHCGCFGKNLEPSHYPTLLSRAVVLWLVAAWLGFTERSRPSAEPSVR
jgi:putative oxidoreductase